jgi:dolichol-phosphate mannosyltransferase
MPAPLPIRVVLPTYNEAENLESLAEAVLATAPAGTGILVVDDASPDGTGAIADRLAAADDRIEVLHRTRKEGLGPAYVAGFARALAGGAERIVQMDADFSHDPADVPRLIAATDEGGAELALGSRYVPGGGVGDWGLLRRAISRWGSLYARAWLGLPVHDPTGGFKCFRRPVLEAIRFETVSALGYAFQIETTYRAVGAGFDVVEVPIVFSDRHVGESKMTRAIVAEAVWRVPLMRLRGARWG